MARRKKWTCETVLNEIKRIMEELNIDHLPTHPQIRAYSTCDSAYQEHGGAKWASEALGVPLAKKSWTEAEVLAEVQRVQEKLRIQRIPSIKELKAHSDCYNALNKYGGLRWAAEQLELDTNRRSSHNWTFETIVEEIKYVMQVQGITARMPSYSEIMEVSTCYGSLKKFGGSKAIADAIGVPYGKRPPKKEPSANDEMKNIKKSKAFKQQKEKATPYGDIQRKETLAMVGTIDLSQYQGMQTYAERMAQHGEI